MSIHYDNLNQIEAVVEGFETCSTSKEDFSHASHLTVALWYLKHNPFEQAADLMRTGLFRFIKYHGIPGEKYNETITLFWLKLVSAFLTGQASICDSDRTDRPLAVDLTNGLLVTYPDSNLAFDYYTRERISSPEAKAGWLEPDIQPFDF
ncbi:MAG: hypothetical protein QOD75_213 [Blastocatellia bacterium]|jgi:hypothetical protein|nr:hypothetical protein [Blastocatellia bacterium]